VVSTLLSEKTSVSKTFCQRFLAHGQRFALLDSQYVRSSVRGIWFEEQKSIAVHPADKASLILFRFVWFFEVRISTENRSTK
jgi:hypothetical protein